MDRSIPSAAKGAVEPLGPNVSGVGQPGMFPLGELGRAPRLWIWGWTCQSPTCPCRIVTAYAHPDQEVLLEGGKAAVATGMDAAGQSRVAAEAGLLVLDIDIDFGDVVAGELDEGEEPHLDAAQQAWLAQAAALLDDDILDAYDRLWFAGKGARPPADPFSSDGTLEVAGWQPGQRLSWSATRATTRRDRVVRGRWNIMVDERYCVEPGCACETVELVFAPFEPAGGPPLGSVLLEGGRATVLPRKPRLQADLEAAWQTQRELVPRHAHRTRCRQQAMHGLAGRVRPKKTSPAIPRNAPCPCGSGRKYKSCCGR